MRGEKKTNISRLSPEEWLLLRPKPMQRSANIMDNLRTYLRTEGQCGNCTAWDIKEKLYSQKQNI